MESGGQITCVSTPPPADSKRSMAKRVAPRRRYVAGDEVGDEAADARRDHEAVAAEAGLWVAAGFSGHGFMIAPSVGRLVADLVAGDVAPPWRDAFRIDRFESAGGGVETHVI